MPFSPSIRDFLAAPDEARRIGPYRCKELLDKAGAAPVYKAVEEHAGLSLREVAIKIFDIGTGPAKPPIPAKPGAPALKPTASAAAEARLSLAPEAWQQRILDEARSLCRVQHPNVIRFHTLATDAKRGLMGLVMEFADGISIDKRMAESEIAKLPPGDPRRVALAVEIGIDISSALAAAHEAGVVHCNVKPSNIMFTHGTHKLINFGIAATVHTDDDGSDKRDDLELDDLPPESIGRKAATLLKATLDKAAAGEKPGEKADEKADAKKQKPITGTIGYVDPVCVKTTSAPTKASDLYSLGAVLYQVVAGDVPALASSKKAGVDIPAVDKKVITGDVAPPPLTDIAASTPPALAKLIDSLVAPTREARPRAAELVVRALEQIRSALAGRERTLPKEERGPWPGLERYEASDRDVFFGRSAEIAGVIELLRTRGLVGIVGLSGSGKSSITRAGLLPAIEEGALGGWPKKYRSVVVTPGQDPMAALKKELEKVTGATLDDHPEAIAQELAADVDKKGEGLVILVDQLEEVVTKFDDRNKKGRADALDLLSRLAEGHVGLRVIVCVRRDLLDQTLEIDPIFARALSRGIQLLSPLSSSGWQEVVDQSLEAYGYEFEEAKLRKEVLSDLKNREGAMTLVQFGLTRLWAARDAKKKKIPRAALSGEGGMQKALEGHANAALEGKDIPKDTLKNVLLAMTTPEGTRTHVEMDVLKHRYGDKAKDVVFALTKARLVVAEQDGFTFVHDSVLKEWGVLRRFIEEARDDRMLVAQLERDARRWSDSKDPAELWRKGRLHAAVELWKRESSPLTAEAKQFLEAGVKEAQKAERTRFSVAVLIVVLILGGAFAYAKVSHDAAVQARSDADALQKALDQVKQLKAQADEQAGEAAATAALLADLRKKTQTDQAAYNANVADTMKKIANAKSLDVAQKATADLKAPPTAAQNQVVALAGLAGGPAMPKPTDGPGPSGGGTFDQAAIERVVNSRKAGVKRVCLDRGNSTAASTKVTATISIAANGQVSNVSTTGDDPAVANCIQQQLKTWSFPAPGESTQVQIPFVFVRQ
jgi:serine/threonine protein kinase